MGYPTNRRALQPRSQKHTPEGGGLATRVLAISRVLSHTAPLYLRYLLAETRCHGTCDMWTTRLYGDTYIGACDTRNTRTCNTARQWILMGARGRAFATYTALFRRGGRALHLTSQRSKYMAGRPDARERGGLNKRTSTRHAVIHPALTLLRQL